MKKQLLIALICLLSFISFGSNKHKEHMAMGFTTAYNGNSNYYMGGTVYNFTILYVGDNHTDKTMTGFTFMYKFNSLVKFLDLDLGLGMVQEDQPTTEAPNNTVVKLTGNCMVGLNIIQVIFKQKHWVLEPNMILNTSVKPCYGITVGYKL